MDRDVYAGELLAEGFNCAQSVFLTYAGELGFEREAAARLTNWLGGGIAGTGGLCGAVSGACMVLSARYGRETPSREGEQLARQQTTYRLVRELQREFAARFGSVLCGELLEKGLAASGDAANEKFLCPAYVQYAANLVQLSLEDVGND